MGKGRLLIVEDEMIVAMDLRERLIRMGYDVVGVAGNSRAALETGGRHGPDMAIMDIVLRGEPDGVETARVLLEKFRIPVIYLTAHSDEATLKRAKETEPFGYITKPFTDHDLRNTLEIAFFKHAAEKRLRESELRYRSFVQNLHAVSFLIRCDCSPEFISGDVERITGYAAEELLKDFDPWTLVPDEDREYVRSALDGLRSSSDRPSDFEFRIRKKDGETAWVRVLAQSIGSDGREPSRLQGLLTDITARKQIEAKLEYSEKFQAIATLAGGIAHNFNNLLTGISGNLSILQIKCRECDHAAGILDSMEKASRRMAELTNRLLAYANAGNAVSDFEAVSLNVVVALTTSLIRHRLYPEKRLLTDLDPSLPMVHADIVQLQMALASVVDNAAEATSETGTITIFTRNVGRKPPTDAGAEPDTRAWTQMGVKDDGVGMTPEVKRRIFDPFFTTKFFGRGLGMSSVYGIARRHGGHIGIESEPNAGTTVTFNLPAMEA